MCRYLRSPHGVPTWTSALSARYLEIDTNGAAVRGEFLAGCNNSARMVTLGTVFARQHRHAINAMTAWSTAVAVKNYSGICQRVRSVARRLQSFTEFGNLRVMVASSVAHHGQIGGYQHLASISFAWRQDMLSPNAKGYLVRRFDLFDGTEIHADGEEIHWHGVSPNSGELHEVFLGFEAEIEREANRLLRDQAA